MARQLDALANRRVRFPQQGWGYQLAQLQKRAARGARGIAGEYIPRDFDSFKEALRSLVRKTSVVGRGRKARRPLLSSYEIQKQIEQAQLKRALYAAETEAGRIAKEQLKNRTRKTSRAVRLEQGRGAIRPVTERAPGPGSIHTIPGIAGRLGGLADVVAQDATNWAYWLGVEAVRQRIGAGGRSTNRTGAAAAPVVHPHGTPGRVGGDRGQPVTVAAPPIAQPVHPGKPAYKPGAAAAARAAGKLSTGSNPVGAQRAAQTTRGSVGRGTVASPANVQFRLQRLDELLLQSILPRSASRAAARVQAVAQQVPRASSAPSPLTAVNSGGLGFVPPQTQTDRCNCEPKRKKRKESSCRNPVVSRTTHGDIRTTKVRLVCQQSKLK